MQEKPVGSEKNNQKVHLFLVVLGGRVRGSHIELHDVRWVIGKKVEDTFVQLKEQWFGDLNGLHIDSYMKVEFIDGYSIEIKKNATEKHIPGKLSDRDRKNYPSLWFVNLGGYEKDSLSEKHEFGLVVANNRKEASAKAKSKWLIDIDKKHKDDICSLKKIKSIDNCHSIRKLDNWEVTLEADKNERSQLQIPDWYGFMRIDRAS